MSNKDGPRCELHIEDIKIKHAEILYLGSLITNGGNCGTDFWKQTKRWNDTFQKLSKVPQNNITNEEKEYWTAR